MAVRGCRA
jgi:hypothetical protein